MIWQLHKTKRRQILIDIDTQRDFLLGSGRASIMNHKQVLANIRRMMAWARHGGIRIISTCEVHRNHNGCSALDYCIDGTTPLKPSDTDHRKTKTAPSHCRRAFLLLNSIFLVRHLIFSPVIPVKAKTPACPAQIRHLPPCPARIECELTSN